MRSGTAKKRNPSLGSPRRLQRCSTTRTPARRRRVRAFEARSAASSIFQKSTPTSAAPPPTRRSSISAWMCGPVVSGLQYLWVPLDDVSELDESTHLTPPLAAEVPAAGAAVNVDRFVLLVSSGAVPVRPGGQSCEPGRVPAVTDEVAVDAVGRRGSGRPEEPLLDAHVGANPGAAMVAEEAEVSGSSVDDAAVYKRAVVEPDHHALLPGGFDAAVDSSAFQRERDKVGTLRAAPADVSHDHVPFDPSRHDADARINADFEVRRERAFDLVPIGRFRAVDGLLSSHSCGRPQVLGLRCARCDKGGDSERHATPKTKTTHDELTPLASLHCFRL